MTAAPTVGFPNMTSFESGICTLHTNSFGCAAVINDPEQREASIRDHTRQSLDGLCDGLAALLGEDPGDRDGCMVEVGQPTRLLDIGLTANEVRDW